MVMAVLTCLCCFWPISIVAIIFASNASSHIAIGDYASARENIKKSQRLSIFSIVIGIFTIITLVIYFTVVINHY